ncbi:protein kilB, partial [Streptomyces sp. NPDC059766]
HPGARLHGADFVAQAATLGAVAVLTDPTGAERAAVTGPLVAVSVLEQSLAEPARQAALAAFDLRDAADHSDLACRREVAIAATDEPVTAAARVMS